MSKPVGYIKDGLIYNPRFISKIERQEILNYLQTIYPIWEERYSAHHPPPEGDTQRSLLRPVYWLGNWQFACLDYYHPPHGIENRCVTAENFPPCLQNVVNKISKMIRDIYKSQDIPPKWELNTCLINFYGSKIEGDKKIDMARVGEHRDFEPGPVASLSLGERALFQFVKGKSKTENGYIVLEQWLDDSSMLVFATDKWKNKTFHRVQRVDRKNKTIFDVNTKNFETRRINFTFRYVPREHFIEFKNLPTTDQEDIKIYVTELAKHSKFFQNLL
jgi:alkylated DNA repair protein (DNA oxidative demethylase)